MNHLSAMQLRVGRWDARRALRAFASSSTGFKCLVLATLALQNTAASFCMRYSQAGGSEWNVQLGVIIQELLKGLACVFLILREGGRVGDVFADKTELLKSGVPAALYLVQNNMYFVALAHLDPATYTVTYQLKILVTAVLSVLLLNRSVRPAGWFALLTLFVGVCLTQLSAIPVDTNGKGTNGAAGAHRLESQLTGLLAVLLASGTSGLAGVYFEKILKGGAPVSLWMRNLQLAGYSVAIGIVGVALDARAMEQIRRSGLFGGFTVWSWAAILNNVIGGLLVAVVIKHADTILKNFATSLSIVLTTVLSVLGMQMTVTRLFFLGSYLVCQSIFMYTGIVPSRHDVVRLFRRKPSKSE